MAQVSAGDAAAFGDLYDRFRRRAYRAARSVCRNDERAEDAVQEAFLSIWRGRAGYVSERGKVEAWLLAVVRYRAIAIARRHRIHATRQDGADLIESVPAPGDVVVQTVDRDEALRLRSVIARLPEAQRQVITLAFYGQLTHAEIGTRLGLPAGTVKARMRLGLQKLRGHVMRIHA